MKMSRATAPFRHDTPLYVAVMFDADFRCLLSLHAFVRRADFHA